MMKRLNEKKIIILTMVLLLALVGLLIRSFLNYNRSLIANQQQQLLKIVRSVSNIMDTYIDNQKNALAFLVETELFQKYDFSGTSEKSAELEEEMLQYLKADSKARVELLIVRPDGTILFQIHNPDSSLRYKEPQWNIPVDPSKKGAVIPGMYLAEEHHYLLPIVIPIEQQTAGPAAYVITLIDLEEIDRHVDRDSVKADQKSYLIVKDQSGYILLHESRKQIGLHAIKGRAQNYPGVDFTGMNQLIQKELEGKENTFIFDSYWFSDEKPLTRAKKFSAFTPLKVDYGFWVVSINMDYNDFIAPFNREIIRMILQMVIILMLIGNLVFLYLKAQQNQRVLAKETEYLRELNTTLAELNVIKDRNRHTERLQMIGIMTGGIAHEFNNILSPIMGYSELLWKELPDQGTWREDIYEVYEASCRARELVQQISSLSYKESSKIVFQSFLLTEKLPKWIKSVDLIKTDSIKLNVVIPTDDMFCYGNATQLYEVVLNLCTNSIHAMKTGGMLTISLSLERKENLPKQLSPPDFTGKYISISVSDTGPGMNEDTLSQIFTPFFTTKKQGEGTGLGLSIVQSIVEAHKGAVWAESKINQGTKITIYLPYYNNEKEQWIKQKGQKQQRVIIDKRIIVIDQDLSTARPISKLLQKSGYIVETYDHPRLVLAAFKNNPDSYQTLITNFRMETMDGVILSRRVRQMVPEIQIIMLSGLIKNCILDAHQKGIIDHYLMKPVRSEELIKLIYQVKREGN